MSTFSRIALIAKAKIKNLLNNMENPEENLEAAWQKQMELLYKLKDSLHGIRTSRQLLEGRAARILYNLKRNGTPGFPHSFNTEDALRKLKSLEKQIKELKAKEKQLDSLRSELENHSRRFCKHKEILRTRYCAARAVLQAKETTCTSTKTSQEIKHSLEKLNDSVLYLEAKAAAIDELVRDRLPEKK